MKTFGRVKFWFTETTPASIATAVFVIFVLWMLPIPSQTASVAKAPKPADVRFVEFTADVVRQQPITWTQSWRASPEIVVPWGSRTFADTPKIVITETPEWTTSLAESSDSATEPEPIKIICVIDLPYVPERELKRLIADLAITVCWNANGEHYNVDFSTGQRKISRHDPGQIDGWSVFAPTVFHTRFLPRLLTEMGFNPPEVVGYATSDRQDANIESLNASYFASQNTNRLAVQKITYMAERAGGSWKLRIESVELLDK